MRRLAAMLGLATAAVLVLAIATYSTGVTGTWQDTAGMTTYHFARNGRATVRVLGTQVAAEYAVDGDRVYVSSPQGTVVLKKLEGRLVGPMGQEFVRQRPE